MDSSGQSAVRVSNAAGASPFVLVCDHASNRIPSRYGDLGLTPIELASHIAWDPGALELSFALSELLDAPLVHSTVSRLLIDANRAPDAPGAIWTLSEATRIATNEGIDAEERKFRIAAFHRPYHDAIEAVLEERAARRKPTALVCVHSFTPVFLGVARPWPIGLIHGRDVALTAALRDALVRLEPDLTIGWNEPYAALNGVTYTLEHHGDRRGLPATMIELRNNEILEPSGLARWASLLARALPEALADAAAQRPAAAGAGSP